MKDTNYAFCVARIRALENKLLKADDIRKLIDMKDYKDALTLLSEKGYNCNGSLDTLIQTESDVLQKTLTESVPDKNELNALCLINDYFNIKALVKCAVAAIDCEGYLVYPTTIKIADDSTDCFAGLSEEHRKIALKAYDIALKTHNGKFCDGIIDKAAIDALYIASGKKKSGLSGRICAFLADTANIKIAFRCTETKQDNEYISEFIGSCCYLDREKLIRKTIEGKEALFEFLLTTDYKRGAEIYASSPSEFEKWCDEELIEMTKASIYTSFGFDPVVSYYYRKNMEIKTVRMILAALRSNTDKNIIHERVRKFYA